jgi:small conductance mechanosensitive channel
MGPVRSVFDQLGRLAGQGLALGEEATAVLARAIGLAAIPVLGWLAYRVLTGLIRRLLRPLEHARAPDARVQRARTLGPLLASATRYLVAFVVVVVLLQELGVDVRALVVSAGVVGLAIGFGAQSLIKDVITGSFLLFENLIAVGDVIEVGPHAGVVEAVGLRVTRIRKFSGDLRIVPNGDLTAFGHLTAGWSRVVVEVGVGYDRDVDQALRALEAAGQALRAAHPAAVLEAPVAEGILRFAESEVVLRVHARVAAGEKAALEMELRRRVKAALESAGIPLPIPRRVVHHVGVTASPGAGDKEPPA